MREGAELHPRELPNWFQATPKVNEFLIINENWPRRTGAANTTSGGSSGVVAASVSGGASVITVRASTIFNNVGKGLQASGGGATIQVTHSTITGNDTGLLAVTGGQIISFGDNSLGGNTTDGVPTSTVPLQ